MSRTCSDCGKPITAKAATGRCLSCAAKRRHADPAQQAAFSAAMKRGAAKRWAKPGEREKLRACMLANRATATPDLMKRANASRTRTALAWCPQAYRDLNAALIRKGVRLAERKVMVADAIAADERRATVAEAARIDAMTPFERDMARIAAGAQLVAAPDLRTAGPAFTLGGIASGML